MTKRFLTVMLVFCLVSASLCGCGKKDDTPVNSSVTSSQAAVPTPTPQPERTAKAVKVNADGGLNIRSTPSTDGEAVGLAENGSMLPLLIEKPSNGWYEVEYNGSSAYVYADYATVVDVTLEEYNKLKNGESIDIPETASSTPKSDDPALSTSKNNTSSAVSSSPDNTTSSYSGTIANEDGE